MMRDFADVSNCVDFVGETEEEERRNLEVRPKKRKTLNLFFSKKKTPFSLSRTQQMMRLQRGFPDFDLDGKEIYLDRVRGGILVEGEREQERKRER